GGAGPGHGGVRVAGVHLYLAAPRGAGRQREPAAAPPRLAGPSPHPGAVSTRPRVSTPPPGRRSLDRMGDHRRRRRGRSLWSGGAVAGANHCLAGLGRQPAVELARLTRRRSILYLTPVVDLACMFMIFQYVDVGPLLQRDLTPVAHRPAHLHITGSGDPSLREHAGLLGYDLGYVIQHPLGTGVG